MLYELVYSNFLRENFHKLSRALNDKHFLVNFLYINFHE